MPKKQGDAHRRPTGVPDADFRLAVTETAELAVGVRRLRENVEDLLGRMDRLEADVHSDPERYVLRILRDLSEIRNAVGDEIHELTVHGAQVLHLTTRELGRAADVSDSTVSRWSQVRKARPAGPDPVN